MSVEKKAEVNLEISSGFFRIPTDQLIYNITVIAEHSGIRVVEKIVEKERSSPCLPDKISSIVCDPYYREICSSVILDIGKSSRSVVDVVESIIAPVHSDIVPLLVNLQKNTTDCLRVIKNKLIESNATVTESSSALLADPLSLRSNMSSLQAEISHANELLDSLLPTDHVEILAERDLASMLADGAVSPVYAAPGRYLFDMDVVFQTLYELCTNETVKTHITTARRNAAEYFLRDIFLNTLNDKIATLEADGDNFFNVPMSDVLSSLFESCHEKPIQNLLKKMDSNQGGIFLDSILPLEVPPREEKKVLPAEAEPKSFDSDRPQMESSVAPDHRLFELRDVLNRINDRACEIFAVVNDAASCEGAKRSSPDNLVHCEHLEELVKKMIGDLSTLRAWEENFSKDSAGKVLDLHRKWVTLALALREQIRLKESEPDVTIEGARDRAFRTASAMTAREDSLEKLSRLLL